MYLFLVRDTSKLRHIKLFFPTLSSNQVWPEFANKDGETG